MTYSQRLLNHNSDYCSTCKDEKQKLIQQNQPLTTYFGTKILDQFVISGYQCTSCGVKNFSNQDEEMEHFSQFHECGEYWSTNTFKSYEYKRKHLTKVHMACKFCGHTHISETDCLKPNECFMCQKSGLEKTEEHFSEHHCDLCPWEIFRNHDEKKDHFENNHEKCADCGSPSLADISKRFGHRKDLIDDLIFNTKCQSCLRSFSISRLLSN